MRIAPRQEATTQKATFISALVICIILISLSSKYRNETLWRSHNGLNDYKAMLEKKIALGKYIEKNIEQPSIFLSSYEMMNYLPGISSKAKVVFFRSSIFTPHPVNLGELRGVLSSDNNFLIKRRIKFLSKHHIQYILIEDASVQNYYAAYPQLFNSQKFRDYWLIEYIEDLTYLE